MLGRYTQEGVRAVKDAANRIQGNMQRAQEAGITIKGVYMTLGEYDQVVIFEAPDDETAAAALIGLGQQGFVRSSTMRAFGMEEMGRILQKLA
jgi:uncharacterized protein with GYD domain